MTHASVTFTTTDDVSAAILAFVASIGSRSEAVAIPALRVDGEVMEVRMTLNADSAFVVLPVGDDEQGEDALAAPAAKAVNELRTRSENSSRD